MDAFYASVEQRDNPELRGRPVAVGGLPSQRGAVCAASYEARKFGIHSAMPSRSAIQRCEHLIFVKPRFEAYRAVSQQIRAIFFDYTDLVEPLSLDEAYLDVTVDKQQIGSAVAIAQKIRDRIKSELNLTASAGVSINKFLAKVASDLNKPDGLSLIAPDQAETFIENLPIEAFYGVGPATANKMKALGIHSGADLKSWRQAELIKAFGKVGSYYYKVARAEDNRPVNPNRPRKSIGAERSFFKDLNTVAQMESA
ncbi:MAG: DNA polymerase IV, partial [Cyanobacteria bacterium J06598_3]